MAESESSELLDVSPYEGGNMLNSEVFRTTDIRWISANLDMREGKAFWQIPVLEQWPCRFWFHVPTEEEWEEVVSIVDDLWLTESIHDALLLPKAWKKTWLNTDVDVWDEWYYHTRIPNSNWTENVFHPTSEWSEFLQMAIKNAISVRWFKNNPVIPTRAWTKLPYGNRPRLPAEYQEVEYIESDWNAYVNTWILSKNINEIEMDISDIYMWSSYADQYSYVVFGTTASSWWFSSTYYTNSWARFRYHKAITWGPHDDSNAPQTWFVNHLVYTRTQFTVNGNVWTQVWTDPSWTNADDYPVCFWYCGNNSKSKYKMYSLKITTNTWEKTFVPCFRKADWAVWLFELSEGEFYANAWTWTFWMWRDIAYLPEEYGQIEYVLNTTGEEYINTWITSSNSFVASFSIMPTLLDSEKWFIWAAWTSEDNLLTYYNWKFRWHNGWNYADTVSASVNSQYYIWIDTTWITINGSKYNVAAWSVYSWNEIWFFRSNWQSNLSYSPRVKYYGLRMWSQWSFVRDYVPCIRESDGVIWFYDLVNRTFHANQGSGAFVAGGRVDPWRDTEDRYPRMKTICYYPLTDDSKDKISWNQPYSSRGSFVFNWKSCSVSTWAMYWNLWNTFDFTKPFTVFQWLRPTQRRGYSMRLWYPMQNDTTTWWFEIWETRSDMWWTHPKFWLTEWSWAWNTNNWWDMPLNERHCFVLVYTWTQLLVYRDWQVMDYSPIIWITSWGWFTPSWTATVMRFSVNNNYDYYDWDVAHLWVETWAWDVNRVLRYYRTFAWDFQ